VLCTRTASKCVELTQGLSLPALLPPPSVVVDGDAGAQLSRCSSMMVMRRLTSSSRYTSAAAANGVGVAVVVLVVLVQLITKSWAAMPAAVCRHDPTQAPCGTAALCCSDSTHAGIKLFVLPCVCRRATSAPKDSTSCTSSAAGGSA
jgi:hypothetical protein